jgi:hypothetical protein
MKCTYYLLALAAITSFACTKNPMSIQGRWVNYKTEFNGRANNENGVPYTIGLDLEFICDSLIDRTEIRRRDMGLPASDTSVLYEKYSLNSNVLKIGNAPGMLVEKLDEDELILINIDKEEYKRWKFFFERVDE